MPVDFTSGRDVHDARDALDTRGAQSAHGASTAVDRSSVRTQPVRDTRTGAGRSKAARLLPVRHTRRDEPDARTREHRWSPQLKPARSPSAESRTPVPPLVQTMPIDFSS